MATKNTYTMSINGMKTYTKVKASDFETMKKTLDGNGLRLVGETVIFDKGETKHQAWFVTSDEYELKVLEVIREFYTPKGTHYRFEHHIVNTSDIIDERIEVLRNRLYGQN